VVEDRGDVRARCAVRLRNIRHCNVCEAAARKWLGSARMRVEMVGCDAPRRSVFNRAKLNFVSHRHTDSWLLLLLLLLSVTDLSLSLSLPLSLSLSLSLSQPLHQNEFINDQFVTQLLIKAAEPPSHRKRIITYKY